jgi:hypothetical protein
VAIYSGSGFCPQKMSILFYKINNLSLPNTNIKNRASRCSAHPFSELINTKTIYFLVILREICVPKKHLFFHKKSMWVGTFLTVFHKICNFSLPNANIKKRATRCSAHYFSEFIDTKFMH